MSIETGTIGGSVWLEAGASIEWVYWGFPNEGWSGFDVHTTYTFSNREDGEGVAIIGLQAPPRAEQHGLSEQSYRVVIQNTGDVEGIFETHYLVVTP